MIYKYDVQNKRDVKKLYHSKRFPKYPDMFLSNTCQIRVNPDELLKQDEFVICSKSKILPKKIYLYGKKTNHQEENNIYLNYWTNIFLKTVEKGSLDKYDFNKSDSKLEMCSSCLDRSTDTLRNPLLTGYRCHSPNPAAIYYQKEKEIF